MCVFTPTGFEKAQGISMKTEGAKRGETMCLQVTLSS